MITRRQFLKVSFGAGMWLMIPWKGTPPPPILAPSFPTTLEPSSIPKYVMQLITPPAMPNSGTVALPGGGTADYYEIAVQQFSQQILPDGMPPTTVWSYGAVGQPATLNYPAFSIEAQADRPVRVKWINGLVDALGRFRPHLLPVDQTLHWANPPGPADTRGTAHAPYTGPVPMVPHLHGGHSGEESDGYPQAWFLPNANNIPSGYARQGTFYDTFRNKFNATWGANWVPGSAVFQYGNSQSATTLWYHDHSLGMTRLNVYAGPAGFYLVRGGPNDLPSGVLPGPAPAVGADPFGVYFEVPIAIQDRTFNTNGSLFYPDNRALFEGLAPYQLDIPFAPDPACGGPSDVSPIWNPEFFGNTIVVNGRTWPFLNVQRRRYRFRFLNGCNSRFLILKLVTGDPTTRPGTFALPFWQIGAEGGFLPAPVQLEELLMSPAERADVIVDFTSVAEGTAIYLINLGPDEPFGGGVPGTDFSFANPTTTGQVMKFIVGPLVGSDTTTPPASLTLPSPPSLGVSQSTRQVSLNEMESATVQVVTDEAGKIVSACGDPDAVPFGPTMALLGTMDGSTPVPREWMGDITETPVMGKTETWEISNFTEDAHPIHVHQVMFQVVERQSIAGDPARPPEQWESGFKDTVIAYPGEITRIKAKFDLPGLYVWHCHIVEHEDNEMMRPFRVQPGPPIFMPFVSR